MALKPRVVKLLAQQLGAQRDDIARLGFSADDGTALCLKCARAPDAALVELCFAALKAAGWPAVRIAFVSDEQEAALRSVCKPFFGAPGLPTNDVSPV